MESIFFTYPTLPNPLRRYIGICAIKWMAFSAMGCLSRLCGWAHTSQTIFSMADWLQMGRVYAGSVSTKMVKLRWYLSVCKVISYTMSQTAFTANPLEKSITQNAFRSRPYPARLTFLDKRPKALFISKALWALSPAGNLAAMTLKAVVMGTTKPLSAIRQAFASWNRTSRPSGTPLSLPMLFTEAVAVNHPFTCRDRAFIVHDYSIALVEV